jgi:hypothetical protein
MMSYNCNCSWYTIIGAGADREGGSSFECYRVAVARSDKCVMNVFIVMFIECRDEETFIE